jgi:hypothetical protein
MCFAHIPCWLPVLIDAYRHVHHGQGSVAVVTILAGTLLQSQGDRSPLPII